MTRTKIIGQGALHALAASIYVAAIVTFITISETPLQTVNDTFVGIVMLCAFVTSVAVMGIIFVARPAMWYMDGRKQEAVWLLVSAVGAQAGITVTIGSCLLLIA